MKPITILLLAFSLLLSCGKKKERILHLKAINPATGAVYPGLEWRVTATTTAGSGEKKVFEEDGTLDANGEAKLSVKLKNSWTYNIRVIEPENICYNKQITMHITQPEQKEQNFLFEFAPCAYLTLSVNNIDCQGANDKILYYLKPSYIPVYNYLTPEEEYGCYSNTFTEYKIPYGPWIVTWEVTKNGVQTNYDSTFFLNENEHKNFTINY